MVVCQSHRYVLEFSSTSSHFKNIWLKNVNINLYIFPQAMTMKAGRPPLSSIQSIVDLAIHGLAAEIICKYLMYKKFDECMWEIAATKYLNCNEEIPDKVRNGKKASIK